MTHFCGTFNVTTTTILNKKCLTDSHMMNFLSDIIKKQPSHRCSVKKVFLEISHNSQENTCARVSYLIKFIKKETLAQMFSSEFCGISKNTLFTEHLRATASDNLKKIIQRNTDYEKNN